MLEIKDLEFSYPGGRKVLDKVSLSLEPGRVGILLGRNGAGKSTLLKTIAGILKPSSGSIEFDGRNITAMTGPQRAATVAYVPQKIDFGELSVYESVLLGRVSFFGRKEGPEDRQVVRKVLADMDLEPLAGRSAGSLSGGEMQKVAIARALAQEPKVLVMDEPTGNLDMANRELVLSCTSRLAADRGIAVLCSIHDLNQALYFGQRFFMMENGHIVFSGGKETLNSSSIEQVFGVKTATAQVNGSTLIYMVR